MQPLLDDEERRSTFAISKYADRLLRNFDESHEAAAEALPDLFEGEVFLFGDSLESGYGQADGARARDISCIR